MRLVIETRTAGEQLLALLQEKLGTGEWLAGERFPSERELAQEYGVSRATANKVVAKLVSEGWLEIQRGRGSFVGEGVSLFAVLQQLESFTDFAKKLGLGSETEVRCVESAKDEKLARRFGLPPRSLFWRVERRRLLSGLPVIFEERWLPRSLFRKLAPSQLQGSFYRLSREEFGLMSSRESASVEAVVAPELSGFGEGSASLRLDGVGYDKGDRALWRQVLYYRGEAFQIVQNGSYGAPCPQLNFRLKESFLQSLRENQETKTKTKIDSK